MSWYAADADADARLAPCFAWCCASLVRRSFKILSMAPTSANAADFIDSLGSVKSSFLKVRSLSVFQLYIFCAELLAGL